MFSQKERRNTLTAQQVTKLVNQLHEKIDDVARFKIQIRLAKHLLEQPLNEKADIDSVGKLISQAKDINARKFAGKEDGLILLYEATLARRTGKADSPTLLLRLATNQLRSSNNNLPLAEAYLELSRNYDSNNPKETPLIRNQFDTLFRIVPKLIPPEQLDSCMATLRNFFFLSNARYQSFDATVLSRSVYPGL